MSYTKKNLLLALLLSATPVASYASMSLTDIQTEWARCQYLIADNDGKVACLESLVSNNQQEVANEPQNSEKQVWLAINLSSLAGAKRGHGRAFFSEKSPSDFTGCDQNRSDDTGWFSLYQSGFALLPGSRLPIGFGSDKKAAENLKKALEINPQGIDSNYFYADFLMQDGQKKKRNVTLKKR